MTLGDGAISKVTAPYSGIYQWTINIELAASDRDGADVQLLFGPSAWQAYERSPHWKERPGELADYSAVYVTHVEARVLRRSTVGLEDVLDGLDPADLRLHDEILRLLTEHSRD